MQKIDVSYLYDNSVLKVVLHDKGGNILDMRMMRELTDLLASVKHNPALKLITFEGYGDNFSYGASVDEHTPDKSEKMLNYFHNLFYTLFEINIPTLAKISGNCLGGGFELPLACNFIFAEEKARIGQPEIVLGVFAPPASILLPLKVGYAKAEELLLTGKIISGKEAYEMGLINGVFENKDKLEEGVKQFIEKYILPRSASSLRIALKAVRHLFMKDIQTALPKLTNLYNEELMNTHDAREGIQAFIEKRKPIWKNS